MDEEQLIKRLRLIEALVVGGATEGERDAATEARARVLEHLKQIEQTDPPLEFQFTMSDGWSKQVFMALLRRYNIEPYRYRGQRRTTVMARVPKRFLDETLWPEYEQIVAELRRYLDDITQRVISQVIHKNSTDPNDVAGPRLLEAPGNPASKQHPDGQS